MSTHKERLLAIRARTAKAGLEMLAESTRFDSIKRHKPQAISAFNLFQTPAPIASHMVDLLGPITGAKVLEPSAGLGRLLVPLEGLGADITAIESNADCSGYLYRTFPHIKLMQRDFLSVESKALYNCVVMNPPFKMGRDIKHIKHALSMLRPGGRLVALCYNGVKQNRELKPIADSWEVLPAKSFKKSGTLASVALLTIFKE